MNKRGLGTKGAKPQGSVARGAVRPLGGGRQVAGFTLIEIMVVVVIIAILAAVAWPNYERHMLRTNRVNCESVLTSAAAMLERNRATSGHYHGTVPTTCPEGATGDALMYNIAVASVLPEPAFILTATPVVGNFQEKKDKQCGTLVLHSNGQKGAGGSLGTKVSECWK